MDNLVNNANMAVPEGVITKQMFMEAPNNAVMNGLVLIRSYTEKPTSNGTSTYLYGTAEGVGSMPFKVWSGKTLQDMKQNDYTGKICEVKVSVNEYNGVRSLIIESLTPYKGTNYKQSDFLEKKYDADELWTTMLNVIAKNCSQEACDIFKLIIKPIEERFKTEFAAINHHDNCVNGLLAHTTKVVRISQIIKFYPVLQDAVTNDVLIIGCALHDIGKVLEYNMGNISEQGKILNHLTLGLTMIMDKRDDIVRLKNEEFYNTLLSVVQQHHGEYGERPKTLAAYIVHLIDSMEAKLTDASEAVEAATGDTIKCEDFYLRFK